MRRFLPAIAGLFLFGCPDDGPTDQTPFDTGPRDTGRQDTSTLDTGTDGGTEDSGQDGGADTGVDTGVDGGADTGVDAGGGGNFTERVIDNGGVHGQGIEVIDLEDDGDLDVIAAFSLSDTVRIYLNDGSASFTTAQPPPDNSIVAMHAVAEDFDGDGDRDIAAVGLFDRSVGSESQGEVTWFENPGDPLGNWTRREITGLTVWYPLYIQAGDLTGDGNPDLVVGCNYNDPNGNGLYWFRNTGDGFTGPLDLESTLQAVRTVMLHDVDMDGILDVIALANNGDEIVWYENLRVGVEDEPFFGRHTLATPTAPFGMRLADMDGDPEMELVASSNDNAGGKIAWYDPPPNPRELWTETLVSADFGDQATRLAAGDFDGDGLTDVASVTFEDNEVRVYFQEANGEFTSVLVMGGHLGSNAITAGDLDRDGRIDLITTTYGFDSSFDVISWWDNEP